MPFPTETITKLRAFVDASCADEKAGIPGATAVVVGRDGSELFAHAAGKKGMGSTEPMTLDTIFWLASCTKMLAGVACMQLVEQGIMKLDDGEHLENLCPELKTLQVLRPDGTFEKKNKAITLRMLLTHTAGFGYSFLNERMRDWRLENGKDELGCRFEDMLVPLIFQPGEGWEYGCNVDWAGIALERASGLKFGDYLQKHVFQPLGIVNAAVLPDREMKAKLAPMHARNQDGTLKLQGQPYQRALDIDLDNKEEVAAFYHSAGAAIFSNASEYCKVLAVLLNDGTCPRTGARLLRKETVDEMFKNSIPQFPNFGRQGLPAARPELTNPLLDLYPVPGNPPQGYGLSFMLSNGGITGRSTGASFWAGLTNAWWWCDRENGVAGMVCTHILPFADPQVVGLWVGLEAEVYKALSQASKI
ncbi:beta-lactamase family protein [Xylaria sp. CBS 124048]|nr:beta-lactamase family protein [Xylaria sp. CBS 124048]